MNLIDLISLSLLFRTGAKGKGTWDFKLQLPVAGSFVSEFRLGPPPGMKAYDVQGEDADDEDEADGGLCQAAWWQQEEDGQPEEEAAPMLLMLLVCASRNPVPGRKRYPQLHLGLVRDASGVK